jgi:hypothetical protein
MLIKKYLNLLGYEVKDRVSDFGGVVVSMCFDLYGCIQADVRPKELDKEGKMKQGLWLDVSRLDVKSKKPLMEQPNFEWGEAAEGKKGPANLPPGCTRRRYDV